MPLGAPRKLTNKKFLSPSSHYFSRPKFTLQARHLSIELGTKTRIMAIVNLTPDSFSNDGAIHRLGRDKQKAINIALRHIRAGADIIDLGGESTRPNASPVSEHEEIKRVIPVLSALTKKVSIPISVDTYKENVMRRALDHGASIINNIKGITISKNSLKIIRRYNAAIVLMHMRGTPQTMQKKTRYQNLIADIIGELGKSIEKCLEAGIKSDRIIVDPGIGFAKTAEQNLEILKRLREFEILKQPILIGTSRKSFVGKILGREVNERAFGSVATVCAGIFGGAHIVRVHDVKASADAAKMTDAILNFTNQPLTQPFS